jgi:hypothetical protein
MELQATNYTQQLVVIDLLTAYAILQIAAASTQGLLMQRHGFPVVVGEN